MWLLNIFRLPPTALSRPESWLRWTSSFRFQPSSIRFERDDPAFLPLCAAAVLLLLLVAQMLIPDAPLTAANARLPKVARTELPTVQVDYPALTAAPIFAPDRKPDKSDTATASRELVLVGVGTAGNKSVASIRDADGVTQRVVSGGTIQGWQLVSTEKDQVTLEKNGLQRTIPLTPGQAVAMPASAAPKKANPDDGSNEDDSSDNSQ